MDSTSASPSYFGLVKESLDAVILFQLAIDGELNLVQQRLGEEDRSKLIKSGNVFIFKESSGIRRWTDSVSWSPSRIVENFLVYREVKKDESGHRRDISKSKSRDSIYRDRSRSPRRPDMCRSISKRPDSDLVGSLADSEHFKEGGLVKRTITAKFKNDTYHLISYYSLEDAEEGRLPRISLNPAYKDMVFHQELTNSPSFRVPLDVRVSPIMDGYDRQQIPDMDLYSPYGRHPQTPYGSNQPPLFPTYMASMSPQRQPSASRFGDSINPTYSPGMRMWTPGGESFSPPRSQHFKSHPAWPSHPTPTESAPRSRHSSKLDSNYSPIQASYPTSHPEYYDNIDHSLGYSQQSPMALASSPNGAGISSRPDAFGMATYDPVTKQEEFSRNYFEANVKPELYGGRLYNSGEKALQ